MRRVLSDGQVRRPGADASHQTVTRQKFQIANRPRVPCRLAIFNKKHKEDPGARRGQGLSPDG
jgi:hypothetical protein